MEDSARIEINMYSFQIPSPTYIPTRFCGTNICTSSACFALSFVRQPNGPECTQVVRNEPKRQFGSNGVDRVRSLRKIPMRLRGMNFYTSSARFAPSLVRQPNGPECTHVVQNAPKRQFGSNRVDRVRSLRKIPTRLRGTIGPFCTEFRKATKRSQMHPNSTKRTKPSP